MVVNVRSRLAGVLLLALGLIASARTPLLAEEAAKPAAAAATTAVEVTIDNFTFNPPEITVSPGTTITWTNRDDIPHVVAEKALSFRSKPIDTGESYSQTFATPGEITYFCTLHPNMTGKVIVKAK